MMESGKEIFSRAVIDGFEEKYREGLAVSASESGEFSRAHARRMSSIIGSKVKYDADKHTRIKRAALAALIAAALLLAGCAAIVYKEQIGDFFINVFDTYIKGYFVSEDSENNSIIEEYYTLTYVPEGYELVDELSTQAFSRFRWNNNNYKMIVFEQYLLDTTQFTLNAESGYTSVVEYADLILYCRTIDNYKYYIWCDDNYSYSLKVCVEIDDNELYQILDGVFQKTN
jgi:hypothetical protein